MRIFVLIENCAKYEMVRELFTPDVLQTAYLYLDPHDNDSLLVRMASIIIERLEPENRIHQMLFEEQYLTEFVS